MGCKKKSDRKNQKNVNNCFLLCYELISPSEVTKTAIN